MITTNIVQAFALYITHVFLFYDTLMTRVNINIREMKLMYVRPVAKELGK